MNKSLLATLAFMPALFLGCSNKDVKLHLVGIPPEGIEIIVGKTKDIELTTKPITEHIGKKIKVSYKYSNVLSISEPKEFKSGAYQYTVKGEGAGSDTVSFSYGNSTVRVFVEITNQ